MSQRTFVFDARLPVSEHTSDDDPKHPKNVARNAALVASQAHADTKYDIIPPPRVPAGSEGFGNSSPDMTNIFIVVCAILISLYIIICTRYQYVKVACIGLLLISIHYLLTKV